MIRQTLLTLCAALAITALAAPSRASSIEWVVDQADFVGLAVFEKVTPRPPVLIPGPGGVIRTQPPNASRLRIIETLKGQPLSHVNVEWSGRFAIVPGQKPQEFLVVRFPRANQAEPGLAGRFSLLAPRDDLAEMWCPLDGSADLVSMRLECHSQRDTMLAAVRRAIAESPPKPARDNCVIPLPPGLARKSTLLVPADARLEALAHQWSRSTDLHVRIAAVEALAAFPSAQSVALLKQMMASDTGVRYVQSGAGKWQRGRYTVRMLAHQLLTRWGEAVPEPVLEGPALVYAPLRWTAVVAGLVSLALPVCATALVAGRRRRTSPQRPLNWRAARRAALITACLVSLVLLSLLWLRSRRTVDEVMLGRFGAHHQLASCRGGLQYIRLAQCPVTTGLQYGRFEPHVSEDFWSISALEPKWSRQRLGLATAHGLAPGPDDRQHPYRLVRIPYWALLAASVLPLAMMFARTARQWRRRRTGRCPTCGYDLRATPGICPECGTSQSHPGSPGANVPPSRS